MGEWYFGRGRSCSSGSYADDISPINCNPRLTNLALEAVSRAGKFNAYKFKPSKCKILGAESAD